MSNPSRVPPHSLEAEMAVLGAMLLGDKGAVEAGLTELTDADFYRDAHAHVFAAMASLAERREPVDPITLKDELNRRGTLEQVGGVGYLMTLGDIEFTTANLPHYARIVRKKATMRRAIHLCSEVAAAAYADSADLDPFLEDFERRVLALRPKQGEETCLPLTTLISRELDAIEERGRDEGVITGLSTGFGLLDWYLRGMQRGDLLILAARPSVGKTGLATSLFSNVTRAGHTALFFSLEMSHSQVTQRILTGEAKVDSHTIGTGHLADGDWHKLKDCSSRLWNHHVHIDDNTAVTPAYMRSVCRRVKAKHGLDLVIVDYLQLMAASGGGEGRAENRNAELSQISRSLKLLAKEFDVPVLALSQLSRAVERRENKRPMLSDLRDSGSLEQDADVVMFLHRDGYAGDKADGETADPYELDPTEVILRKQRMGPTGTVKIGFIPAYACFVPMTEGAGGAEGAD